ncbi:hypothetical protein ASG36_19150 [Geodermatophilus sp. Leaf369]|uniref:hypothetical protein n=1 Tax=Geodermatophilaceae TaxID=85030 RepID=UPI0006FE3FEC|nr:MULTISPECIES: hypothetical protein [Geodermatophilaceae]KQS54609.1 hypothetical protein ASG36_19150 [Geodermatophilus sp. Leaf369]KQS64287.1 hypothetical protein ASG41_16605 [Modestobacter sp. Leaf380]
MKIRPSRTTAVVALTVSALAVSAVSGLTAASADGNGNGNGPREVRLTVESPTNRDNVGVAGAGWMVDLGLDYDGGLAQAGYTGAQLTGPAGHNNIPPFPGTFSTGKDDRLPGLVVLVSTTNGTLPGFSGPGTNLANLFNLTGVTDRDTDGSAQIRDTWIVGAPIAGQNVDAILTVAVVGDLNGNGILDDAPGVVQDADGDGDVDRRDLEAIGLASNVERVQFRINGAPA